MLKIFVYLNMCHGIWEMDFQAIEAVYHCTVFLYKKCLIPMQAFSYKGITEK